MIPGFVQIGAIAVLLQLVVVAGVYAYVRRRRPIASPAVRTRVRQCLGAGATLAAGGQLVALGAVGYLRVGSRLSFGQAITLQKAGVLAALAGYAGVLAGFAVRSRADE